MTEARAEKVANVVLSVAVAGAVWYALRDPTLRRAVGHVARRALAGSGPWLISEVRKSWAQTGVQSGSASEGARPRGI